MPDRVADALAGTADRRPLPPALRSRLEAALLSAVVPEELDARVSAEMIDVAAGLPAGLDAPRALPPVLRRELERRMSRHSGRRAVGLVAAAASFALVAAVGAIAVRRDDAPPTTAERPPLAGTPRADAPSSPPAVVPSRSAAPTTAPPKPTAVAGAPVAGSGAGGVSAPGSVERGPAPPYVYGTTAQPNALPRTDGEPGPPPPSPAPRPALTVDLRSGDAAAVAGFRAYVDLLNSRDGVNRHQVRIAAGSGSGPRSDAVVTVNLGAAPIAAGFAGGALLETLDVAEASLRGTSVFHLASAVDRQAHLAVDAVFPAASIGSTAVVVTATNGVYADLVASAYESVLRERGVASSRVVYTPGQSAGLPPADALFVSLGTADAAAFFGDVDPATLPALVAGTGSLLSESMAGVPDGTTVLSPYRLPAGDEATALRRGSGRPITAASLHGWVTAKALAYTLWQSDADTATETASALHTYLPGYDAGRLIPKYGLRRGTRSRTPEALVYERVPGGYAARSDFRTDPH